MSKKGAPKPIKYVKTDLSRLFKSKAQILADKRAEKEKEAAIEAYGQKYEIEKNKKPVDDVVKEVVDEVSEMVKPRMGRPKKVQEEA